MAGRPAAVVPSQRLVSIRGNPSAPDPTDRLGRGLVGAGVAGNGDRSELWHRLIPPANLVALVIEWAAAMVHREALERDALAAHRGAVQSRCDGASIRAAVPAPAGGGLRPPLTGQASGRVRSRAPAVFHPRRGDRGPRHGTRATRPKPGACTAGSRHPGPERDPLSGAGTRTALNSRRGHPAGAPRHLARRGLPGSSAAADCQCLHRRLPASLG